MRISGARLASRVVIRGDDATLRASLLLLLAAAAGSAAAQPVGPKFDAVSIPELEQPQRALGKKTVSGSLVTLEGYSVSMLAGEAYGKKREAPMEGNSEGSASGRSPTAGPKPRLL